LVGSLSFETPTNTYTQFGTASSSFVGWLVGCRICIDCRQVLSLLAVDNVGGSNGWYIGLVTMLGGALLVGGEVKVLFNTLVFGKVAPQCWLAVY
jgi:hypothetical protein